MKRLRRDVAAKRDPVYDSDDDLDATQNELSKSVRMTLGQSKLTLCCR